MAELRDVVHAINRRALALEALGPARAGASKVLAPAVGEQPLTSWRLSDNPYRDGTFIIPVAAPVAAPVADAWASHVEVIHSFVAGLQALCEKHGVSIETRGPQLRLTTTGARADVDLGCGKPSVYTITSPK